jgi:hypothetical protein
MEKLRLLIGRPFRFLAVNILDEMSGVVNRVNKDNHGQLKKRLGVLNAEYLVVQFSSKLIEGYYDHQIRAKGAQILYLLLTFLLWVFATELILFEETRIVRVITGFIFWVGFSFLSNMKDIEEEL